MKAKFPYAIYHSYINHHKQSYVTSHQPVVISALLMIGMIVLISLANFNANGDVDRCFI